MKGLLAQAFDGHGRVAVVSGPVASGKTELLRVLTEEATQAGVVVLHALCGRTERGIPFGVLRQLLDTAPHLPEGVERPCFPKDIGIGRVDLPLELLAEADPVAMDGLCGIVLKLAETTPLLISVDDVQHADDLSLQFLLYLTRRIRTARVMVVINEWAHPQLDRPLFYAEILRQPHCSQIRLGVLTEDGVRRLLEHRLDEPVEDRLLDECYAISGGNPLLVHALIDDLIARIRSDPAHPRHEIVVREAYAQAVVTCLYRMEPELVRVAAILAIADTSDAPGLLDRMLDAESLPAERTLRMLDVSRITRDGRFRHPAARDAVLANLDTETLAALNLRAAHVLYQDDRPVSEIARLILLAGRVDESWQLTILQDAADAALCRYDTRTAIECLELTHAACDDERMRTRITIMLAGIKWRSSPSIAMRQLMPLSAALKDGSLDFRHALALIRYLLRSGRMDEAEDALTGLRPPRDPDDATAFYIFEKWLAFSYPQLRRRLDWDAADLRSRIPTALTTKVETLLQAVEVLAEVLRCEVNEETIRGAEEALQDYRISDATVEAAGTVIAALIYADRADTAAAACDRLLAEALASRTPTWAAMLSSTKALIAFRLGDLAETGVQARRALDLISAQGWGVGIGVPLAGLLLSATLTGDLEAAEAALNQEVPEALCQTRFGLHYRHARGVYYLATGRPQAALREFLTCGELMVRWGIDIPTLAPWRLDAARAYLHLDKRAEASRLIDEQMRMHKTLNPRISGMALRLRAVTEQTEQRIAMLTEAVRLLEGTGDRLELAGALADLSRTHLFAGEHRAAEDTKALALRVIKESGAEPLRRLLTEDPMAGLVRHESEEESDAEAEAGSGGEEALTDAERRVAALVTKGYTNRQVALSLYITISTVEQHMTRVYRKLNVARRKDLPERLAELERVPRPARS